MTAVRGGIPSLRAVCPAHHGVVPFVPACSLDGTTSVRLQVVFSAVEPFAYVLTRTGWFGRDVWWLTPEPAGAFVTLTRAACAAFPGYRPYGGQFDTIVPHLTMADRAPLDEMLTADTDVTSHLPVAASAEVVTLMAEQPNGSWVGHSSYPFRRRGTGTADSPSAPPARER